MLQNTTGQVKLFELHCLIMFINASCVKFLMKLCSFNEHNDLLNASLPSPPAFHYIQQERNPRKLSANAKITFFVPINLLIVLISHVRVCISLNIRATDCDFVYSYLDHQCVGIAVRDDMTNINLEITNDTIFNVSQHLVYPTSSMRSIDHG